MTAAPIKAKPYKKAGPRAALVLKAKKARPAKPFLEPGFLTLPEAELANLEARQKRLLVAETR
jgi:hypothetical protein